MLRIKLAKEYDPLRLHKRVTLAPLLQLCLFPQWMLAPFHFICQASRSVLLVHSFSGILHINKDQMPCYI